VLPACRSIDCVSVLALTVADAAQVLAVMEGPDPADAYSVFVAGPAQFGAGALRVGIPREPVFGGDAGYAAAFDKAVAQLEALGHRAVPLDFAPLHAVAELLYGGPWVAERHAVAQPLMDTRPRSTPPCSRSLTAPTNSAPPTPSVRSTCCATRSATPPRCGSRSTC
jgi:allophanate hydrolase